MLGHSARLALAVAIVSLMAGCGPAGSGDDSARAPDLKATSTMAPVATKPATPTAAEQEAAIDALEMECWGEVSDGDGISGILLSLAEAAARNEGNEEGLQPVGWSFAPTDEVVGGGWRLAYRWKVDNGVTEPSHYQADFLVNPRNGKALFVGEWAGYLARLC